jgi:soluble epoxide hydrolase / lipid-phosphate phosphatase
MDSALYKSTTTSRSYIYSYYASATKGPEGTILFLHGFPEYSDMWSVQVKVLENLGYNCIVPDLLGYGESSKPYEADAYNSEGLSQDIAEILDAEKVDKAIVIGHDWGSYLAGRFANWQPSRIFGLVITSVAYRPPAKLDLATANAQMKAGFGYEPFGYWTWIASPEAPKVLEDHVESLFSLLFAKDSDIWKVSESMQFIASVGRVSQLLIFNPYKTDFTPTGKLQEWLLDDRMVEEADFMKPEVKANIIKNWKEDGFGGKLGWYRAMTENAHWEHEQRLVPASFKLTIPVLFIGGSRDAPAPAALGDLATKPFCTDYTGKVIDSGHWMLREKPEEWLVTLLDWLKAKF